MYFISFYFQEFVFQEFVFSGVCHSGVCHGAGGTQPGVEEHPVPYSWLGSGICRLYPDSSRKEISDRLSTQVLDLLRIMQERIDQQTWNNRDIELVDGLKNISVMHTRLGRLTEKVLNGQARESNK